MSEIAEDIRERMMGLLGIEEQKTDLEGLSIISRVGMKIVSANSMELDADAVSASCTALIDLGIRLSNATNHGSLTELILHNKEGYSILMAIDDEYLVFCGLKAQQRIGFYLGYLRDLALKLRIIISGEEITEVSIALEEAKTKQVEQKKIEKETIAAPLKPSVAQDKAALDGLLNFLDDWDAEEKAAMGITEEFEDLESGGNIVGIPQSISVGLATGGTIGITTEAVTQAKAQPQSRFKVYDDEVPPIPLNDYTPMEVEDESSSSTEAPAQPAQPVEELPPLNELPSFDALNVPDFNAISNGSE